MVNLAFLLQISLTFAWHMQYEDQNDYQIFVIFVIGLIILIVTLLVWKRFKNKFQISKATNILIKFIAPIVSIIIFSEFNREYQKISRIQAQKINSYFLGIFTGLIVSQKSREPKQTYLFVLIYLIYSSINISLTYEMNSICLVKLLIFYILVIAVYHFKKKNQLGFANIKDYLDSLKKQIFIFNEKQTILYSSDEFNQLFELNSKQQIKQLKYTLNDINSTKQISKPSVKSFGKFVQKINKSKSQQTLDCKVNSEQISKKAKIKIYELPKQNLKLYYLKIQSEKEISIDQDNIQEIITKSISKVSHEMRTPLNAILSMLECLEKDVGDYLNQKYVQPCLNSVQLLMALLNDILDHAQLGKNKLLLNVYPFNFYKFLQKILSIFRIQADKRNIELLIQCDFLQKVKIYSDQNRIKQIIINLIGNALKFTKQNVILFHYISNKGKILIRADPIENNIIKVSVKDDGIGIKEEDQSKLFSEFGKIISTENKSLNIQGVGLGLQISQELAVLLGPENNKGIQIYSKYGYGSEFYFFIQNHVSNNSKNSKENISESELSIKMMQQKDNNVLQLQSNQEIIANLDQNQELLDHISSKSSNRLSSSRQQKYKQQNSSLSFSTFQRQFSLIKNHKFLIVDDNEFNVMALKFQLEKLGIVSDSCYSGKEALFKLHEQFYKVIFMDIEMPEMDGFQATKAIKELYQSTIIIGCTGYTTQKDKNHCLEIGMNDVIEKPVQKKVLKQVIKQHLKI